MCCSDIYGWYVGPLIWQLMAAIVHLALVNEHKRSDHLCTCANLNDNNASKCTDCDQPHNASGDVASSTRTVTTAQSLSRNLVRSYSSKRHRCACGASCVCGSDGFLGLAAIKRHRVNAGRARFIHDDKLLRELRLYNERKKGSTAAASVTADDELGEDVSWTLTYMCMSWM